MADQLGNGIFRKMLADCTVAGQLSEKLSVYLQSTLAAQSSGVYSDPGAAQEWTVLNKWVCTTLNINGFICRGIGVYPPFCVEDEEVALFYRPEYPCKSYQSHRDAGYDFAVAVTTLVWLKIRGAPWMPQWARSRMPCLRSLG